MKRKTFEVNNETLENQMKKVKISQTPGELRLKRDLQDVEKIFPNLQFDIITPSFLHVIFPEYSLKPFLARFSISIPRFYPHSPPEVKCESAFCPIPNMITSQGDVIHPELTTYWTAIKGLIEVINILERIRSQIIQTNIG